MHEQAQQDQEVLDAIRRRKTRLRDTSSRSIGFKRKRVNLDLSIARKTPKTTRSLDHISSKQKNRLAKLLLCDTDAQELSEILEVFHVFQEQVPAYIR